jgi:cell division protein FtsZ
MIEFTQDGPFADKADQLFPDRVRILGLGQTGASMCDQLIMHGRPAQDIWVFDSDQLVIEASVVPNRHLLGRSLVHGLGCGGDIELAREIVAMEEEKLAPVVRGCDFLILVLGLAGATGVAVAERLIELGREAGAKVIVVGVQPFACEGWAKREKSTRAIADLRRDADSVLVLSHDRLAEHESTQKNIRHGFHLMHQLLAKTTQALAQVVCKRGLIQLSFADVRSLYGRYTGSEVLENCWVAHVEGSIHDCTEELIEELLAGPLLRDEAIWKQIDHAIVAVSGTRNLGLSDVQEMVGALKDLLPVNIPIATSASLDDESHDKVRMSVLLAMTTPVTVVTAETDLDEKPVTMANKKARPVTDTAPLPGVNEKAEVEPPLAAPAPQKTKTTRIPKSKPAPEPVAVENDFVEEQPEPALSQELIETSPLPAVTPSAAPVRSSRRFVAKQEEMQFEAPTRGRFEKTHETMYRGENLDQPTFRRRGLKIKV